MPVANKTTLVERYGRLLREITAYQLVESRRYSGKRLELSRPIAALLIGLRPADAIVLIVQPGE